MLRILLAVLLLASPLAAERAFRVSNGTHIPRSQWVPCGLPFAEGELAPGGSVIVQSQPHRLGFKILERWGDGSVRRALVDVPIALSAFEERDLSYEASDSAPEGGFLLSPAAISAVSVRVDSAEAPLSSWQVLAQSPARWDGIATARIGGLNVRLYLTLWTGQTFSRATVVLGNDDLVRSSAAPVPVSSVRVRFAKLGAPIFGYVHDVRPIVAFREYEILRASAVGDGARWGTTFLLGSESSDIVSAAAEAAYPLLAIPTPGTERETEGYGLFGVLKGEPWPPVRFDGSPFSRQHYEDFASWWIENAENSQWGRNGFWQKGEGSTGGHPDWGPGVCGRDDLARSARGYHRWLALSLTRLRTPDHYSGLVWDHAPVAPVTSSFNGWVNAPLREPGDYGEHAAGSNGWSGTDESHREPHVQHRVFQLFGEEWLREELALNAQLACLASLPIFPPGEGRAEARKLQRRLVGWLVSDVEPSRTSGMNPDRRAALERHFLAWGPGPLAAMPSIPGPGGNPIHGFSVCPCGNDKCLATFNGITNFAPCPGAFVFLPFSEAFVGGTVARALTLLGEARMPGMGLALDRQADLWTIAAQPPNAHAAIVAPGGILYGSVENNVWSLMTFSALRSRHPKLAQIADAIEAFAQNAPNGYDVLNWTMVP